MLIEILSYIGHLTVKLFNSHPLSMVYCNRSKWRTKKCFSLGDYNINLFNAEKHHLTSEFLENMFSYEYIPLINKPTRDSGHTASLIDNIYCNQIPSESTLSGLFYTDVSDHYPIFHIENKYVDEEKPHRIIKKTV